MTENDNAWEIKARGDMSDGYFEFNPPGRYERTRRSTWILIFLLTLFLHASLILFLWIVRPFSAQSIELRPPDPIQLVFVDEKDPLREEPTTFTELPEDREDEKPETPDFLSNIDSRARDMVDGGAHDAFPNLAGESEAPHVRMDPDIPGTISESVIEDNESVKLAESTSFPHQVEVPVEISSESSEEDRIPDHGEDIRHRKEVSERSKESEQNEVDIRNTTVPQEITPSTAESTPRNTRPPLSGTADLYQDAMEFRTGNTDLSGIVSMNTTRWAYAPWLQRFRRNMMRSWLAPVAYYMGIIHGFTTVELEIAPDGSLVQLNVMEEEGHVSLHETSTSLFKVLAPYHPLPPDFPEKSLILRIKLVYPPRR